MKNKLKIKFEDIISADNLLSAWQDFVRGKRHKADVQLFSRNLIENILSLRSELANGAYKHGGYHAFAICDPKPRQIHKASVRDRLLHHAIYRLLYPFFDKTFIADSFSCRIDKGTHKAINRFREFAYQASRNNTKTCWVLKCDIRKFFANIDHGVLLQLLQNHIPDKSIIDLLERVIKSFETAPGKGLPLGNLTSQLFVNIYMNEFDQFVKHKLKARYYIRYADDFAVFGQNKFELIELLPQLKDFLFNRLHLIMHPNKISLRTLASGIDFLGWIHFPHHRTLRAATKRRMLRNIRKSKTEETVQSYLGLLKHGDTFGLRQEALNQYWLWREV